MWSGEHIMTREQMLYSACRILIRKKRPALISPREQQKQPAVQRKLSVKVHVLRLNARQACQKKKSNPSELTELHASLAYERGMVARVNNTYFLKQNYMVSFLITRKKNSC